MSEPNKPQRADNRRMRASTKTIGNQLRQLYDDVAKEPVPDDFLKLLEEADEQSTDEQEG